MPARALVLAATVVAGTGLGALSFQAARTALPEQQPTAVVQGVSSGASASPSSAATPSADPCTGPGGLGDPACTVVVTLPAPAAAPQPTATRGGTDDSPTSGLATPRPTATSQEFDDHDGDRSGRSSDDDSWDDDHDDDRDDDDHDDELDDHGGDTDRDDRVEPGDDRD